MIKTTYTGYFGIEPASHPLAINVQCHKHGNSVWAICDCNTTYFVNIGKVVTDGENIIHQESAIFRYSGFTTYEQAEKFATKKVRELNHEKIL